MSNQPHPETDAAAWVETNQANALALASFARKLERQRDEALELAQELRDALVAHYEEYSDWSICGGVHNRVVAALTKAKEVLP